MSASLAKMLGKPEAEVAKFVERMEDKFCYPSQDVRLLAEVNHAVQGKIAGLGLDPRDTTAQELYHALQAKFTVDSAQIDKALGVGPDTRYESRLARAIEVAKQLAGTAEVWALKPTTAKKLLLSTPPKKIMKQLHYRTIQSMLKHENIGELYLLAAYVESQSWRSVFSKAATGVASNDYCLSPINFVCPAVSRWQTIAEPPNLNICNKLTGAVSVWPAKSLAGAPLITLSLMLLQGAGELGVNIDNKNLAAVHPSLRWWANMEHLVSAQTPKAISLNLNDVAHNHLNSAKHQSSISHHGAKALWDELADRYQTLAGEAGQVVGNEVERLMPAALAAEYQEA